MNNFNPVGGEVEIEVKGTLREIPLISDFQNFYETSLSFPKKNFRAKKISPGLTRPLPSLPYHRPEYRKKRVLLGKNTLFTHISGEITYNRNV